METQVKNVEPEKPLEAVLDSAPEPTFVLRGQDISAPIVVLFWADIQPQIRARMDAGLTMEQAAESVKKFYGLQESEQGFYDDPKLDGAVEVAKTMRDWPRKKLAD